MKKVICLLAALTLAAELTAQTPLTKEQILAMSTDELSELPLEDLMQAVETLGVGSVDELFALIMNKNVSSASKSEESTFTSQLATTVITKDELRNWGATTIEDAFRLIPGMIVSQRSNGVFDIHMRGLNNVPDNQLLLYTNNTNMQLMVDGRSVQNLITGIVQMEQLPISIEDVERIEVVRGACSALYGMNAVTGIVNIITEKPNTESKSVSGSAQIGVNNSFMADFALRQVVNDKVSFGISVNGQRRDRGTDKLYIIPQAGLILDKNNAYAVGQAVTKEQLAADPDVIDVTRGGFFSISDVKKIKTAEQMSESQPMTIGGTNESDVNFDDMFPDPSLARQNLGINGYIHLTPASDVAIDITGGYQTSFAVAFSPSQDFFSMVGTTSKTGYVNVKGQVKNLSFLANYTGGPQDFTKGVPGFKVKSNIVNAQAEYDIDLGEVSLRPGVAYNYLYYKDYPKHVASHPTETVGFFGGGDSDISVVSPSLRAQWSHGGFRLTGAIRADKTSKPDKWNVSGLAAASYEINDNNFIRLAWGHAFRGPIMMNTSVDYTWYRDGISAPSYMFFKGDDSADLMNMDNIELGYRWKPTSRILLDAELFASRSQDYGSIQTVKGAYTISKSQFATAQAGFTQDPETMAQLMELARTDYPAFVAAMTQIQGQMVGKLMGMMDNYSQFEYRNLPFKVYQMGLSLNLDWIVSSKLIVKLNANLQTTKVDNYYEYRQNYNVGHQVSTAAQTTVKAVTELVQGEMKDSGYATAAFGFADYFRFRDETNMNSWSQEEKNAMLDQLMALYQADKARFKDATADHTVTVSVDSDKSPVSSTTIQNPLSMYYAMKYGILRRQTTGEDYYDAGITETEEPELRNGHKHKATPSIYGMVGLIWKPIPQLNFSAYGNFIGKRTYNTTYTKALEEYADFTTDDHVLDPKFNVNFKLGYKPSDNVEIFFNAQNLFDSNGQEMVYSDKIDDLYTVGIIFGI